jgi:transposase
MSRPYSEDLRARVVAAVEGGQSRRGAAALFSIGISTAIRWVERHRRTGSVKPSRMGGRRPPRIAGADREWLLARLAEQPDLTLEEMRQALAEERGLVVGHGTVCRFCRREAQTLKKNSARHAARSPRRR